MQTIRTVKKTFGRRPTPRYRHSRTHRHSVCLAFFLAFRNAASLYVSPKGRSQRAPLRNMGLAVLCGIYKQPFTAVTSSLRVFKFLNTKKAALKPGFFVDNWRISQQGSQWWLMSRAGSFLLFKVQESNAFGRFDRVDKINEEVVSFKSVILPVFNKLHPVVHSHAMHSMTSFGGKKFLSYKLGAMHYETAACEADRRDRNQRHEHSLNNRGS